MTRYLAMGLVGGALALTTAGRAHALTGAAAEDVRAEPEASPLSVAAALVPGLLVHGSGHFAGGDSETGLRLLAIEGAGVAMLAGGFVPIVATGASRRFIGPAVGLTIAGVGLFAISGIADLYGVLAPRGGTGAPSRITPAIEASLGYNYVYDPVFRYRHFANYGLTLRGGRWRLEPSAWLAFDDENARYRALVAHRFTGPKPKAERPTGDGSFLDLELALTRHVFMSDRFATTTGEVLLSGRLDMRRVGPSLRGSFAEAGFGSAVSAYEYRMSRAAADLGQLFLGRFGYGMYLGWPGAPRGEVSVYYDHRHDGFAAGLKVSGLGSGVAGHFGIRARYYLSDELGVVAEAAAGSAYVTGFSLVFRHGEPL